MPFTKNIPDWLISCFRIALLGEIYQNIRAIAVGYDDIGKILIRYYIDREPTEFDINSIEIVSTNLDSIINQIKLNSVECELIYTTDRQSKLNQLSGFIYARMETENDVIEN